MGIHIKMAELCTQSECNYAPQFSYGIQRSHVHYWPFYCEENIWHLCQESFLCPFEKKVVFISNKDRCFAMKHQRASPILTWDYHVILLFHDREWKVADLDSSMRLPCPIEEYLANSFAPALQNFELPMFRVVGANHYIQHCASDRRHMRNADGTFMQPPPPCAPIRPESGEDFNLWDFVDVVSNEHGLIYELEEMYNTFASCNND